VNFSDCTALARLKQKEILEANGPLNTKVAITDKVVKLIILTGDITIICDNYPAKRVFSLYASIIWKLY
jgi:hypothetical protein